MNIIKTVKTNVKKFIPSALKKRFGMAHHKPKKHGRRHGR
jgi:hypothetical protein